jgi:hypothetical protein
MASALKFWYMRQSQLQNGTVQRTRSLADPAAWV